jgi:hypothetical protein
VIVEVYAEGISSAWKYFIYSCVVFVVVSIPPMQRMKACCFNRQACVTKASRYYVLSDPGHEATTELVF